MIATPGYGNIRQARAGAQDLRPLVSTRISMQEYTAYIASTFKGNIEGEKYDGVRLETPFTGTTLPVKCITNGTRITPVQ